MSRVTVRRWAAGAACGTVLSASLSAAAAPPDAATAEALFLQGRRGMETAHYREACQAFAESQRLDPGAGTLMNLAACEEKIGKLASAWEHWKEALDALSQIDDRLSYARSRVQDLEGRLPHLSVTLAESDPAARVLRDQIELRSASRGIDLPVDPGEHEVTVVAPGRMPTHVVVTIGEAERKNIEVHTGAVDPQTGRRPAAGGGNDTARILGWTLGALGVAGVGAAAVTGVMVLQDKSIVNMYCPNKACVNQKGLDAASQGKTLVVINAAALGVGLAGLAFGTYFLVSAGHGKAPTSALAVTAGPQGAGFTWSATF
jgi:hypothetical protein